MTGYFSTHNHTMYSNLRLLDCINKPKDLIDAAINLGLTGIVITDHEALCAHMEVNQYAKELKETHPDFTIGLGNEIYLTDTRDMGQKYYHFILIAKNRHGYRGLTEMSSVAWLHSYSDRGLERVPLLKSELKHYMETYKGDIIATTACCGSEVGQCIIAMEQARANGDTSSARKYYKQIVQYMEWCIEVFGTDNFYVECAPSSNPEQIMINKKLQQIAKKYGLRMIFATDSHYISTKDRYVHKAYLNSKEGEREVDSFYEFSHLMAEDEARELLRLSFSDKFISEMIENTLTIQSQLEWYDLTGHARVPQVKVKNYPKQDKHPEYPTLHYLYQSDDEQDRYWINQCEEGLIKKGLVNDKVYWDRLEEEADIKKTIGEKLQTNMFSYPITLQHYINLFWDCGSTVGCGRGSACSGLNHFLLGITQLNPVKEGFPFWRYLNKERIELGDIDLDLAPSRLSAIFEAIRAERGELGLVQVATFGTETTKSSLLVACRGYRSTEYPNGIDVDVAQYLSSMVPVERGFVWPLADMVYGNESKGRKPITAFIKEVEQYPGLLDIAFGIEGVVSRRGSHASGVILFDEDTIFDSTAVMRTPSGAIVTQWDLHKEEAAGNIKYDFLLTSVQDIIVQAIHLLQQDNVIDPKLSLREAYDQYLAADKLPLDDPKIWDALTEGSVVDCFQFDSAVGALAAKKIRPRSVGEMSDANGLMRLMPEEGGESPLDKYVRFKNNISLWYKEMDGAGLTKEEQKALEPHFLSSYGVPPSQEKLMQMLMDENICGFTLKEANNARKIVGKKKMNEIPALKAKVLQQAKSKKLGEYVWKCGIGPQMGYSFSEIHAKSYSYIGVQCLYLATHFSPVYWNTACLIVDSGSLESTDDATTDYKKVATALNKMRHAGIKINLPDINTAKFGFTPNAKDNSIVFGLKALTNIGDDVAEQIIQNQPYVSVDDFIARNNPKKTAMISLIKAGAFDKFEERYQLMQRYIGSICDKKQKLNLQNLNSLMQNKLLPVRGQYKEAKSLYEFNRYLKAKCKGGHLDERAINFLTSHGYDDCIQPDLTINTIKWNETFGIGKAKYKTYIDENQQSLLMLVNKLAFQNEWNKYALGNYSAWEMEVLGYYHHEHELAHVDTVKYQISDFAELPEEPVVESIYSVGGHDIPIYQLTHICGTCIAKNKIKNTVTLLTPTSVVNLKLNKELFNYYDKQLSTIDAAGDKHVSDKSWWAKGTKLLVMGMRRGDDFVLKKYKSTPGHRLYKIIEVQDNGELTLQSERNE